jgi:hypothetical protein
MMELMMLNNTLMRYSIHFVVNLAPAEERFGYFIQDGTTPRAAKETTRVLRCVFGEFNGQDRIISKVLWPPRAPDPVIFICGKNSKVLCISTIHMT